MEPQSLSALIETATAPNATTANESGISPVANDIVKGIKDGASMKGVGLALGVFGVLVLLSAAGVSVDGTAAKVKARLPKVG